MVNAVLSDRDLVTSKSVLEAVNSVTMDFHNFKSLGTILKVAGESILELAAMIYRVYIVCLR